MGLAGFAALAIGPGLVLVHSVWSRDRRREPLGNLSVYFLLGALSVVPAAALEALLRHERWGIAAAWSPALSAAVLAFLVIGPAEEGFKLLALRLRGGRDRHLDEPFDWVVYAVAVSLGFATIENCAYVAAGGLAVGLLRAVTAVPAHAFMGTLMGWRLARVGGMAGAAAARERWLAWIEPSLWHAAYDSPLLVLRGVKTSGPQAACVLAWLGATLALWTVCARRLRVLCADQRVPPPPLLLPGEIVRRTRGLAR